MKGFPPLAKNCLKATNQMHYHLADLHSVGNQFESWQGDYFLFITQSFHGFIQTQWQWQYHVVWV